MPNGRRYSMLHDIVVGWIREQEEKAEQAKAWV
jgi:hypothetical protein